VVPEDAGAVPAFLDRRRKKMLHRNAIVKTTVEISATVLMTTKYS
jgi:hypothetical protein